MRPSTAGWLPSLQKLLGKTPCHGDRGPSIATIVTHFRPRSKLIGCRALFVWGFLNSYRNALRPQPLVWLVLPQSPGWNQQVPFHVHVLKVVADRKTASIIPSTPGSESGPCSTGSPFTSSRAAESSLKRFIDWVDESSRFIDVSSGHIWLYVGCIRRFDLVGNAFGLAMLSGAGDRKVGLKVGPGVEESHK